MITMAAKKAALCRLCHKRPAEVPYRSWRREACRECNVEQVREQLRQMLKEQDESRPE